MSPKAEAFEPLQDAAQSAPNFRIGDVIGERYELEECIGSGAMGAVFRAHDRVLDAPLALKLIRLDPERTDNERATRRLLQEARAIARISHPGIVRVFDFGCVGGVPFIAMELLQGESLLDFLMREGPLDPLRAVRMMLPVLDAVSVAHRRGVVHRDIKPENVFLANDEFERARPKLVDFGVARLREGGGYGLTRPGALLGTPDYMAPEQAQAEPDIDQRADVWACAVVLYELLTMRRPFNDGQGSYLAVLKAVVTEAPRPFMELSVDQPALWEVVAKALAKARHERFQSVRAFGEALACWLVDRGVLEDAYGSSLRASWLLGDHSESLVTSSDSGSVTLRRARPLAASEAEEVELATDPPPALATPPRMALSAPVTEQRPKLEPPISRFRERRPETLESAHPRRLTPLTASILAAVVATLVTASIFWALTPRAPAPPPAVQGR